MVWWIAPRPRSGQKQSITIDHIVSCLIMETARKGFHGFRLDYESGGDGEFVEPFKIMAFVFGLLIF